MSNYNGKGKDSVTYDAIVIGSGISGGFAAMELCNRGYKTLVLERGRDVKHGQYPTANLDNWQLGHNNMVTQEEIALHYFKQNRLFWWVKEENKHWIAKDDEYPYDEVNRFDWIRGHHVGGRSIMWGRHCYRWSDIDFEGNARDGVGVDWPIRYKDIEPWYDYVETFVGISGQKEGLRQVPDGKFLKPFQLNCAEQHMRDSVAKAFPGRVITPGRVANLTEYNPAIHKGLRGQCQSRNRCVRGCPYGAYFSSVSVTLPLAADTGNLTIRPFSAVAEIIYDVETKKATGVRVVDTQSKKSLEFFSKIIFCNASTVGSTAILLNSRSDRFPNGLGNDSDELGHNMMDHHYGMGVSGILSKFEDTYYKGRKPLGFYIPRFQNIDKASTRKDYIRGFSYQGGANRTVGDINVPAGESFKKALLYPGPYRFSITCFGEMLPYHENKMYLNFDKKDRNELPTIVFDAKLRENEMILRKDGVNCGMEMLDAAGCKDITSHNEATAPGAAIHEMGTARMGKDPKTSILNKWNQVHDVKNVFVTDGSCMTSSATQNPSITYMALTARAVDYAHRMMNRGDL